MSVPRLQFDSVTSLRLVCIVCIVCIVWLASTCANNSASSVTQAAWKPCLMQPPTSSSCPLEMRKYPRAMPPCPSISQQKILSFSCYFSDIMPTADEQPLVGELGGIPYALCDTTQKANDLLHVATKFEMAHINDQQSSRP